MLDRLLIKIGLKKREPKVVVLAKKAKKKIKKTVKQLWKKGVIKKFLVVLLALAFLATSVLPYVISAYGF